MKPTKEQMNAEHEIEFRGQRVDNREWVYGDLLQDKLTDRKYIFGHDRCFDHYSENIEDYEVDPATVGQFCNKLRLFDGDIFSIKRHSEFYDNLDRPIRRAVLSYCFKEELWEYKTFLVPTKEYPWEPLGCAVGSLGENIINYVRKHGNIHDNKEKTKQ